MTGFYETTIAALTISSSAFLNYEAIPTLYTCEGKNISPSLISVGLAISHLEQTNKLLVEYIGKFDQNIRLSHRESPIVCLLTPSLPFFYKNPFFLQEISCFLQKILLVYEKVYLVLQQIPLVLQEILLFLSER